MVTKPEKPNEETPSPVLVAYREGRADGEAGREVRWHIPGSLSQIAYNRGYREGAGIARQARVLAKAHAELLPGCELRKLIEARRAER